MVKAVVEVVLETEIAMLVARHMGPHLRKLLVVTLEDGKHHRNRIGAHACLPHCRYRLVIVAEKPLKRNLWRWLVANCNSGDACSATIAARHLTKCMQGSFRAPLAPTPGSIGPLAVATWCLWIFAPRASVQVKHYLQSKLLGPIYSSVNILQAWPNIWLAGLRPQDAPVTKRKADSIEVALLDLLEVLLCDEGLAVVSQVVYGAPLAHDLHQVPLTTSLLSAVIRMLGKDRIRWTGLKQQPSAQAHPSPCTSVLLLLLHAPQCAAARTKRGATLIAA
mmetsp:Transcript_4423/g.7639  ORF Transcript_4423/g.7639 Transcript_4423/m.7639 type:complete len:278 (-) Transcript_4423:7-840(-)